MTGKEYIDCVMYDTDRIQTLTTDSDFRLLALNWINRVLDKIQAEQDGWWWRFLEKTAEMTTIANQMTYDFPGDIDTTKVITLRDKTNDFTLKYMPITNFDEMVSNPSQDTGQPIIYTIWNSTLKLWPVPSGAYTMDMRYIKNITKITDSNSSSTDIPNKYSDTVVQGALIKAFAFDKDYDAVAVAKSMYDEGIIKMKSENEQVSYVHSTSSHRGGESRSRDYDQSTRTL